MTTAQASPRIEDGDVFLWLMMKKESSNDLIGEIAILANGSRVTEIRRADQRQRYGPEAIIAANDFWFSVLEKKTLFIETEADNIGVLKLADRSGMIPDETGEIRTNRVRRVLSAEDWAKHRFALMEYVQARTEPQ